MQKCGWSILQILTFALLLTSCSFLEPAGDAMSEREAENAQAQDSKETVAATEAIELSAYAEEVGATISQPQSQRLAVERAFSLQGHIREAQKLKGTYIWVLMNGPDGGSFDYYLPLEDGHFGHKLLLFEGEGEYSVTVRAPDTEKKDHFYDIATLTVTNESTELTRDIAMRPPGVAAGLHVTQPVTGYAEVDGRLAVSGTIDDQYNGKNLMIREQKEDDEAERLFPIKDGAFSGVMPLHYGAGMHEIRVMIPDLERDNYFLEAAVLLADNTRSAVTEPVTYFHHYYEQQFQLTAPQASGLQAGETFRVSGSFNATLENNREVEQLIVTTKKDDQEASYLISVHDGNFDDEFWLRFGAGEYEVTLNIPTNPAAEQSYFEFAGVAQFKVTSDAEDQRNLMPSRGIQSDAPAIGKLAKDLTRGKKSDRAKAKAIYQYVAKSITYDVEKLENDTFELDDSALKTLETGKGVCQDYAFLAVALLRSAEVEARYVSGKIQTGDDTSELRHAWVEAKVADEWLVMDPTWGAGYVHDGAFVAEYNDTYFDPDPSQFSETHVREGEIY